MLEIIRYSVSFHINYSARCKAKHRILVYTLSNQILFKFLLFGRGGGEGERGKLSMNTIPIAYALYLPTPVGPKKANVAMGLEGSDIPALER